ncbi:hypothetical protein Tco_0641536 [Tanacetum coccineum]
MQNYTRYDAQSFYDAMIFNMDSLGKYMLELILHQQRTPQLLKQKKLMQTQEDHSNPIPALNVDSLKVDLVVIQNTCSRKEDILSKDDLKGTRIEHGFKRAFMSLFGQDVDTFTRTMLLNVDQLQKQLDKDEFQEDGSMTAFWVVNNQFQKFIDSKFTLDYDSQMTDTTRHQRQYERRVNKRQVQTQESKIDTGKALDADLVNTESIRTDSIVQDEAAGQRNDTDCRMMQISEPIYDEESNAVEQTTSLLANNVELKAQIQEKVFAIAALKNDLRKLKGNSVDTKFDKTSVLGKPVLPSLRNQSVNLSKPVTQHYLPKKRESTFAKPDHMIASSSSRNSSKNMPRFSSNDMVHNHYLDAAKKKIQERDRTQQLVVYFARIQTTTDDRKPNPRSNSQTSRVCLSDLRWKPTGRIFKTIGLRWIPTGKLFQLLHNQGTSLNGQQAQIIDLSAVPEWYPQKDELTSNDVYHNRIKPQTSIQMTSVTTVQGLNPHVNDVCSQQFRASILNVIIRPVHNSSGLNPQCQMTSVHISSGLDPQCQMTFEQNGSSLAPQCQQKFIKQLRQ